MECSSNIFSTSLTNRRQFSGDKPVKKVTFADDFILNDGSEATLEVASNELNMVSKSSNEMKGAYLKDLTKEPPFLKI
jgi:hypothetical protein